MAETKTELERSIARLNSLRFEIALWEKVKVAKEGEKKIVENAYYKDDPLFPSITVKGFNEGNNREEKYNLPCYVIISDWSYSDWEEAYKKTGETPAYSFPDGVKEVISCHISNLYTSLENEKENKTVLERLAKIPDEHATYYLIDETKVAKRLPDKTDYLFQDTEWVKDTDGILDKCLKEGNPKELTRLEAMEKITDQTVDYLLAKWVKKYADEKTDWDEHPQWFVKCVSVNFTLNGIYKSLRPKDFPFEDGTPDDGFIEYIGNEISEDLRAVGASVGEIWGFPD